MIDRKLVFIQPDGPQGITVKLGVQNGDLKRLKESLDQRPEKDRKKAETIREVASDLNIPLADH